MIRIVDLTDALGRIVEPEWLARAQDVHRQLRPQLPADYAARIAQVCAGGGRLAAAVRDDAVAGVAVWRLIENTFDGRKLYVDDLVTDETQRSSGVGAALLAFIEARAAELGCASVGLDSGTQRLRAHRFYFRAGYSIVSFVFKKPLL